MSSSHSDGAFRGLPGAMRAAEDPHYAACHGALLGSCLCDQRPAVSFRGCNAHARGERTDDGRRRRGMSFASSLQERRLMPRTVKSSGRQTPRGSLVRGWVVLTALLLALVAMLATGPLLPNPPSIRGNARSRAGSST